MTEQEEFMQLAAAYDEATLIKKTAQAIGEKNLTPTITGQAANITSMVNDLHMMIASKTGWVVLTTVLRDVLTDALQEP